MGLLSSVGLWIKAWLLLDDSEQVHPVIENWKISALRIILLACLILTAAIVVDSSRVAYALGYYHIFVITLFFYTLLILQLICSWRYYHQVSWLLLLTIGLSGICIHLFISDPHLVLFGSIVVYSLPMVALVLLGMRAAIACMLFNLFPLYISAEGITFYQWLPFDIVLENTNWYLNSLIFLVFNICLPLAAARTIAAAAKLGKQQRFKNEALSMHHDLYRSLFADAANAHIMLDRHCCLVDFNQVASRLFKLNSEQIKKSETISRLLPQLNMANKRGIIHLSQAGFDITLRYSVKSMSRKYYSLVSFEDVSSQIALTKQLESEQKNSEQMKSLDAYSGLPNSMWFRQHIERLIERYTTGLSIVVVELANSQYIKQKCGSTGVSLALQTLAKTIRQLPIAPMAVARVGEFSLGFICIGDSQQQIVNKMNLHHQSLCASFMFEDKPIKFEVKCGIALMPQHGQTPNELISAAIYASSNAFPKHACVFNPQEMNLFFARQEIADVLADMLQSEQQQLYLVYQAKVNQRGELIGLEALLRWTSPQLGPVSPAVFIPIAEERGLVVAVTRWVIERSCKQIREWLDKGLTPVSVAINLSAVDLEQADFVTFLLNRLTKYKIHPRFIELELTESALGMSTKRASEVVEVLYNWGFTITIDDFGSGYSNLSRLVLFPVTRLKIDRQFVVNIHQNSKHAQMVKTIIAMCDSLDIEVLAEGIELRAQLDQLLHLGCQQFQGFGFAKPCLPEHVEKWLASPATELKFNPVELLVQQPIIGEKV